MGDSVHGSSRFNREVVAHVNNPAPAGRLLLHCLRLQLPTLPDADSAAWKTGTAAADEQQLEEHSRSRGGGSENARQMDEDSGEAHRQSDSGDAHVSDSDHGWTPPSVTDHDDRGSSAGSGSDSPGRHPVDTLSPSTEGANEDTGEGNRSGEAEGAQVEGLEVYAEPPGDMLAFLRGMTWWEEGMIQAAERSGR